MRYAQIKGGQKLHIVYEAGEGPDLEHLIPAGHVSAPLCHTSAYDGHYRMTINMPLGHACHNCWRIARAMRAKKQDDTPSS